ncbi:RNA polymerase sigma factor [Echinicola pacifica]|uniref:RNA polymerase sigma factor n=1 Tax=Echinicola pacifica TaxID=346377 RepID=A0A918QDI8_9BACT|nr:RNA polymerase sigma factor [Echinicola pacifica]
MEDVLLLSKKYLVLKGELEIINNIREGDEKSFQLLYHDYSPKVYNTALSYTKSKEAAEEVCQDVFMKIYKNARQFKGESSLSTWIYRITVNTALNHLKKNKRFSFFRTELKEKDKIDFEHPGVRLENKDLSKFLFKAMDTLPEKQKTAFILSFIEELPRQEVADIMDLSLKAVESLLQRAKKNMRPVLEKIYPNRRKN